MEPTVVVVRHGTTGKDDVLKGMMNIGLNREGRAGAKRVASYITSKFDVGSIHHSPLLRGAQTAHYISQATGVPAKSEKALGPMDIGWMSGMDKDEAKELMQYYISHPDKAPRGGQPLGKWYEEFADYFSKRLAEAKRSDKALVDVTHSSESVNIPSVIKGGGIEYRGTDVPAPATMLLLRHIGGKWTQREVSP